jgi:putative inorganic carbon (hco3(-)) transporter
MSTANNKIIYFGILATVVVVSSLVMVLLPLKWQLVYIAGVAFLALVSASKNKNDILFALLLVTLSFRIDKKFIFFPYMGGSRGLRIGLEDIILISLFFVNIFKYNSFILNKIRRVPKIVIPWFLFLFVSLLSNINSGLPLSGIGLIIDIIRCFTIFVFAMNYFTTERRVYFGIILLAITVLMQGVVTIYQYKTSSLIPGLRYLGQHDDLYQESWLPAENIRAGGTLGGPNDLAGYMVLILPVLAAILVQNRRAWSGLLVSASIILGITGLIFTFSRSGWACLGIALTLFAILYIAREGVSHTVTPAIVLTCLILFGVFYYYPLIKTRLLSDDFGSSYSRIPLMINSMNAIKDNPFLGLGINNYSASIRKYDTTGIYAESSFRGGEYPVHNVLLLHFAELGVVGGCLFCWLWIACFREVFRCSFTENRFHSIVAMGVFSGMIGQFVFYQVQWGYFESYLPFWVVLALCLGCRSQSSNNHTWRHA